MNTVYIYTHSRWFNRNTNKTRKTSMSRLVLSYESTHVSWVDSWSVTSRLSRKHVITGNDFVSRLMVSYESTHDLWVDSYTDESTQQKQKGNTTRSRESTHDSHGSTQPDESNRDELWVDLRAEICIYHNCNSSISIHTSTILIYTSLTINSKLWGSERIYT